MVVNLLQDASDLAVLKRYIVWWPEQEVHMGTATRWTSVSPSRIAIISQAKPNLVNVLYRDELLPQKLMQSVSAL